MVMSPRLLRPRQTSFTPTDSDARTYVAAVEAADGQKLENAVKRAINDFVIGAKADGVWSAIKASCILMGARTLSGALTPLVGSAPTNNGPFVSGDYNRKTGLIGDGSTKWLDSKRACNADPQNNCHVSFFASTADNSANRSYFRTNLKIAVATGSTISSGINFSSLASHANINNQTFFGLSRSLAASYERRLNGSTSTISDTSATPSSATLNFYRRETASQYSQARLAFYSMGEALDLALLGARVSTLFTAIGAAI